MYLWKMLLFMKARLPMIFVFCAEAPGTENRIQLIINIEAQNDFYPGYPIINVEYIIVAV